MEKFGVVIDTEHQKIADLKGRPCPSCGSRDVEYRTQTPICPRCGTAPWEPHRKPEDFRR